MFSHMQVGSLERERYVQQYAGRKFRERDMCSHMQVGSLEREICAVICR
jgi:hypothetical protein